MSAGQKLDPELTSWFKWMWWRAIGVWLLVGVVVFAVAWLIAGSCSQKVVETAGQLSDGLGSANGLFSAVAVFLVGLSIHFQTTELRAQREELALQREQLELQREELKLSRIEMTRATAEHERSATALAEQVEISKGAAVVTAMGAVASALIEAVPDKLQLRNEYQQLMAQKYPDRERWKRAAFSDNKLEYRTAAYLVELEERANGLLSRIDGPDDDLLL